jgi:membrane-bound lytic murein transglycosylase B
MNTVRAAAAALIFLATAAPAKDAPLDVARPEVQAFIAEMEREHRFDRQEAVWILRDAVPQARIVEIMDRPAESALAWWEYRARFLTDERINGGVAIWNEHRATLEKIAAETGVPAQYLVAITGVETFYGRITGSFRVLDVLTTLAFDFPTGRSDRSPYFRDELEQFLLLARREGVDPPSVDGSFAGAIGLPQFMPGSINRYALDFDGDGRVDLGGSAADAIGSIAQFLSQHGWQRGMPPVFDVVPPEDRIERARLLVPDISPSFSAAQLVAAGATLPAAARAHPRPLALVMVENGDAPASYVVGTENFYALTRYNRSSYYALAVIELGAAVKAAR